MNETELKEFLVERVKTHWEVAKNMLFLADVPSELREHKHIDYRDVLGEKRLKAFVSETEQAGGYRLVQHPNQKAKLGLVPYEEKFEFPDSEKDETKSKQASHLPSNTRKITLDFLAIVNSLPMSDRLEVNIPTRVIAKLLND